MPRLREATWVSYKTPRGEYRSNPPEPETWLYRRDRNGFVWRRHVRGKDLVSLSEAAAYLKINPATAWSWAKAGKLRAKRRGRVRVVRFAEVYSLAVERGVVREPNIPKDALWLGGRTYELEHPVNVTPRRRRKRHASKDEG